MKKIITVLAVFTVLSFGLFAENGRVVSDITYNTKKANNNMLHIVTYYTNQAIAYDAVAARLNEIKLTRMVNGNKIMNIRESDILDINGKVEATVTYDERRGSSNMEYKITKFYAPKLLVYESVNDQINTIKTSGKIRGSLVSNLIVGDIKDITGGYSVDISYTDKGGTNQKINIYEYYDPKISARDFVEKGIANLNEFKQMNGYPVTNLKVGNLQEEPGGFLSDITYTDKDGRNVIYHIDEFYDTKLAAKDYVEDQILMLQNAGQINGSSYTNLKVSNIKDANGEFSAVLDYTDAKNVNQSLTIHSFYDLKAKAVFDINNQINSIKSSNSISGDPITNLKVSKIRVL